MEEYLEAVDGLHARCIDSIHQLVDSWRRDFDNGTWLLSSQGKLADRGRSSIEACRTLALLSRINLNSWEWTGIQTIMVGCYTQCMWYSVNAVLGANWWSSHGEIERDDLILCSGMIFEWWTRKREMGDHDENYVEHTSRYEKSGAWLDWLGRKDLVSV